MSLFKKAKDKIISKEGETEIEKAQSEGKTLEEKTEGKNGEIG